ncbi:hypothetical protein HDV02_005826 [Globomyces sp. JEL0801]|nr:hypothetical protein HDV02_005826 [Globomyces sp. JEL0801]
MDVKFTSQKLNDSELLDSTTDLNNLRSPHHSTTKAIPREKLLEKYVTVLNQRNQLKIELDEANLQIDTLQQLRAHEVSSMDGNKKRTQQLLFEVNDTIHLFNSIKDLRATHFQDLSESFLNIDDNRISRKDALSTEVTHLINTHENQIKNSQQNTHNHNFDNQIDIRQFLPEDHDILTIQLSKFQPESAMAQHLLKRLSEVSQLLVKEKKKVATIKQRNSSIDDSTIKYLNLEVERLRDDLRKESDSRKILATKLSQHTDITPKKKDIIIPHSFNSKDLNEELQKCKNELLAERKKISLFEAKVLRLNGSLERKNSVIEYLERHLKSFEGKSTKEKEDQIINLQKQLDSTEKNALKTYRTLKKLEGDMIAKQNQLQKERNIAMTLQEERNESNRQISDLKNRLEQSREEVLSSNKQKDEKIGLLETSIHILTDQIHDLTFQVEKGRTLIEEQQKLIHNLSNEADSLKLELASKSLQNSKPPKAHLSSCSNNDTEVLALKTENMESQLNNKQSPLTDMISKVNQLEREISMLKEEINEERKDHAMQLVDLDDKIYDLQSRLEEETLKCEKSQNELKLLKK